MFLFNFIYYNVPAHAKRIGTTAPTSFRFAAATLLLPLQITTLPILFAICTYRFRSNTRHSRANCIIFYKINEASARFFISFFIFTCPCKINWQWEGGVCFHLGQVSVSDWSQVSVSDWSQVSVSDWSQVSVATWSQVTVSDWSQVSVSDWSQVSVSDWSQVSVSDWSQVSVSDWSQVSVSDWSQVSVSDWSQVSVLQREGGV
ncbi:hypothetical protein LJC08_02235 [Methanimicrococcus sp. OttesenSCG-928-J09]|nr:hypothetical protein [Methanimicrococcus sp. OttesenSCG-928-J09]